MPFERKSELVVRATLPAAQGYRKRVCLLPKHRKLAKHPGDAFMLHLNRQTGLALLIAEQNLDFCLSLAQKAYVMSGGTVARTVTTDQLRTDNVLLHEMLSI